LTTGGYEWGLPDADEMANMECLTQTTDAFDEGRYRQVYFTASSDNCVQTFTRPSLINDGETQTITITVWPTAYPEFPEYKIFSLDTVPMAEVTVEAGTQFVVITSEIDYHPNGFMWNEPTQEFACVTVQSKNYGEYNSGYRVWLLTAKGEVCEETVQLLHPDWWTGD
jgi:hypothetical protein